MCAEENKINFQIECFEGIIYEKVRENRLRRIFKLKLKVERTYFMNLFPKFPRLFI